MRELCEHFSLQLEPNRVMSCENEKSKQVESELTANVVTAGPVIIRDNTDEPTYEKLLGA